MSGHWQDRAACRGRNPDDFVIEPTGQQAETKALHDRALLTCEQCNVVANCLQFALLHDERTGVWGATTPRQRRELKRDLLQGRIVFLHGTGGSLELHAA